MKSRRCDLPGRIRVTLLLMSCLASVSVSALEFDVGAFDAQLNTQLSIGAGWRADDRDIRHLGQLNQNILPGSNIGSPNGGADDGNWNFGKGDTYSKIIKGTTEFSIGNEHYGLVTGARYFYDFELKDESRTKDDTGYSRQLIDETLDQAGADIELMNAYLHGTFEIGRPQTVKIGRQVLSWGEGLFMQGGVNIINPVDASAARVPGARLKEIFEPVNMLSGAFELSNSLSLEAFIQLDWERTEIDPCGTFFSFNDVSADGCGPIILASVPDSMNPVLIASNTGVLPRLEDRDASDSGQFGIALHWYLDQLNGGELGFYYLQYHSRLPYFSGVAVDPFQVTPTDLLPIPGVPSYYFEYPEDIRLYGFSFSNTLESGYSVAAEYSFRENLPVQWNSSEVVYGGLMRLHSRHLQQRLKEQGLSSPIELAGKEVDGYDRFKVSQLQLSTIKFFDYVMGANQLSLMAEAGGVYIHGFPDIDSARYGRADSLGNGNFDGLGQEVFPDINPFNPATYSCTGAGASEAINSNPMYCDSGGYTSQFSWGYVLALQLDYQAVFPSINMQPEFFFSHDVKGNAPAPMGLFVEGRKSAGFTLKADYDLSRYQAAIGYVHYYGGGVYNVLNDRDHVTASLSVSF